MASLVIFGAAGDVTGRYLLPSLARLSAGRLLPPDLRVRGVGREDLDGDQFRKHAEQRLDRHAADVPVDARREVLDRLDYVVADVTEPAAVAASFRGLTTPVAFYLALPPSLSGPTVTALARAGFPPDSRIVPEKPFGSDQDSARKLNWLLAEIADEDSIFRVWDETLALEGRAALRDMLQNHLLQLLCLVAMEPPHTLTARDLRDRKVDVLRAVRALSPDEVARHTTRARYTAGCIGDRAVPDYVEDPGVDAGRETETYAAVTCWIDNWRWAGAPFRLRSGKALGLRRSQIAVRFRDVRHLVFGQHEEPAPNDLRLMIDPDRIDLSMNLNGAGDPFDLEPASLETDLAPHDLPAYSRLLLDICAGDATLSIRGDEAEEAWRIMDPVLAAWAAGATPLQEYPAGSLGPQI
jgi:glucose-6-phosphate 1-dehydrogenase